MPTLLQVDRETRAAYDAVAEDYARLVPDLSLETPLDRAVLDVFVDLLSGDGPVADLGCGTGRVTGRLTAAGVPVVGLDLSAGMLAIAAAAHPAVPFAAAHAAALPLADGVLAGVLAWYSLINLPTGALPAVFAEVARVTRPGAPVLVAFQSGDGERVQRTTSYGRPVPLTYHRHRVEEVEQALAAAGFEQYASVRRAAVRDFESTPQAALLVRRGVSGA